MRSQESVVAAGETVVPLQRATAAFRCNVIGKRGERCTDRLFYPQVLYHECAHRGNEAWEEARRKDSSHGNTVSSSEYVPPISFCVVCHALRTHPSSLALVKWRILSGEDLQYAESLEAVELAKPLDLAQAY